jgi:hypothetical protein
VSNAEVFLWPLFGFLMLATAGAAWQWRNAPAEAAARERILKRNLQLPRWQAMPQWDRYNAQQQDPERVGRSAVRRAIAFGIAAFGILLLIILGR